MLIYKKILLYYFYSNNIKRYSKNKRVDRLMTSDKSNLSFIRADVPDGQNSTESDEVGSNLGSWLVVRPTIRAFVVKIA